MTDLHVARIGTFSHEGRTIFFEGRRFNALAFQKHDPSTEFMSWLVSRALGPISSTEIDDPGVLAVLSDLGFLTNTPDLNVAKVAERFHASGGKALSLHLVVAQFCNLACKYCYNGQETYETRSKARMTRTVAEDAMRLFLRSGNLDGCTSLAVNFLGGEPLLNWPVISHVLEHMDNWAAEEGFGGLIRPSLQTNLTFLPKDFVETVRAHDMRIVVEIDGPKDIHDDVRGHRARGVSSYDATARNCTILRKAGIPFHAKAVLTADNIAAADRIRKTHKALGAQSSAFSELRPVDSDHRRFDPSLMPSQDQIRAAMFVDGPLRAQIKSKATANILRASAGATVGCHQKHAAIFSATANGEIYTCPWFVRNEAHYLGRATDLRLDMGKAVQAVAHLGLDPDPVCRRCAYFAGCSGPCPVTRELAGEDGALVERIRDLRCAEYVPAIQSIVLDQLAKLDTALTA